MGIITQLYSGAPAQGGGAVLGTPRLILSRSSQAPPSPSVGDMYIVPVGATGVWSGQDNNIASWSGQWVFTTPSEGWQAYVDDENKYYIYTGAAWGYDTSIPLHAATHQNAGGDEVATATPAANVIPKTGGAGKLDIGFMPDAVVGGVIYKGTWDAATNTPTLASGIGTKGDYYVVSVPGSTNLDGITDWKANDWAIFNGTVWEKVDNTDQVTSVFTRTGAVTAQADDYTHAQLATVGVDDHHTKLHAASHRKGGGDLINVENLGAIATDVNSRFHPDGNGGVISSLTRWLAPAINTLDTPPVSPVTGDRYIIGSAPTGIWVGKTAQIAHYDGWAWQYLSPVVGQVIYDQFTHTYKRWYPWQWAWIDLNTVERVLIRKYTGDGTDNRVIDLGADYDEIEIFPDDNRTRTEDHLIRAWALLSDNYGVIVEDGAASNARSYVRTNGYSRWQGKMSGVDADKIKLGNNGGYASGTNYSARKYTIFARMFSIIQA